MADLLAAALVVCFEANYQVLHPFGFTFGLDRMESIFIPIDDGSLPSAIRKKNVCTTIRQRLVRGKDERVCSGLYIEKRTIKTVLYIEFYFNVTSVGLEFNTTLR